MTPPLVSVVIPVYNGGRLLRVAVDSVLGQDYAGPIEVVVVDDGSTEPIEPFAADVIDRVRIVRQPHAGVAAARNRGIRETRGEFVAFLDHDDFWDRDKLSRQMPLFTDPDVALVHSGARWADTTGNVTSAHAAAASLDTHALLVKCEIEATTAVVRRFVFTEIGGFDESVSGADDKDMWIRIADRFPIAAVPEPLATKVAHARNTSRDAEHMYAAGRRILAKHADIHGSCPQCRRAHRQTAIWLRSQYYQRARWQARAGGLRRPHRRAAAHRPGPAPQPARAPDHAASPPAPNHSIDLGKSHSLNRGGRKQ